jgi:hypothetical protein
LRTSCRPLRYRQPIARNVQTSNAGTISSVLSKARGSPQRQLYDSLKARAERVLKDF